MRQRSITGPLVLVIIGILFLLNNLRMDIPVFALFNDYWPFLLILLGVIGLVEVLYYVGRGAPLPPRPVSGGGWLVLLFILICLWGASRRGIHIGRLEAGGMNILGTSYEYDVNAKGSTNGISRVILDNIRGNVSVKGEDSSDILVSGRRTVRAFNRNDADRANSKSQVRFERQGDLLIVHAEDQSGNGTLEFSSDLDITMPKRVALESRGRSGDISVDSFDQTVDISNNRGDVRVSNIAKNVKIETQHSGLIRASNLNGNLEMQGRGGDVQLENIAGQATLSGEYSGTLEFRALAKPLHFESHQTDLRVESIPGNVTLDLGELKMKSVVGPVHFQTRTRDIQIEDVTNSLEIMVDRGDMQITPGKPLPRIDVHSRNGNIELTMPENAAFELKGATQAGEIENDYGAVLTTETTGHTGTIRGSVGKGPQINLVTDRGTIAIKKVQ